MIDIEDDQEAKESREEYPDRNLARPACLALGVPARTENVPAPDFVLKDIQGKESFARRLQRKGPGPQFLGHLVPSLPGRDPGLH